MTLNQGRAPHVRTGTVIAGSVLLAVGIGMLLDTTGLIDVNAGRLIGPFVLIAIGTSMLPGGRSCRGEETEVVPDRLRQRRRQGWLGGVWLIGLGCWLLVSQTHLFGLDFGNSWPLLLMLMGAIVTIRGWR